LPVLNEFLSLGFSESVSINEKYTIINYKILVLSVTNFERGYENKYLKNFINTAEVSNRRKP